MASTPERKLKNLLAKMVGELYCPQFQSKTYDAADIPTREVVDKYFPRVKLLAVQFTNDQVIKIRKILRK